MTTTQLVTTATSVTSLYWLELSHPGATDTQVVAYNGREGSQIHTSAYVPPPGSTCCGPEREHGHHLWHDGASVKALRPARDF